MAFECTVRKLAEDVFLFVCFKLELIKDEPTQESRIIPNITADLMNNLKPTVFMQMFLNELVWADFFKNHFQHMTSSPYRFVTYSAYACYILIKESDAFLIFLNTLSIMTHFAYLCLIKGSKNYINICLAFFCEFFEREIRDKFECQGSWKNFNEFLLNNHFLKIYKEFIRKNFSPFEYFKTIKNIKLINDRLDEFHGVNLKNVTRMQVETHENAVEFANSVSVKMEEIFKQPLGEIFMNSVITDDKAEDNKVGELSWGTVAEIFGCMASKRDPSASGKIPDEASGNIPDVTKTVEQEVEKETAAASGSAETLKEETVKIQGGVSSELHLNPKSGKSEKAKELLDGLSLDIRKLVGLVQSLCDEHGVQTPIVGKQTLKYRTP